MLAAPGLSHSPEHLPSLVTHTEELQMGLACSTSLPCPEGQSFIVAFLPPPPRSVPPSLTFWEKRHSESEEPRDQEIWPESTRTPGDGKVKVQGSEHPEAEETGGGQGFRFPEHLCGSASRLQQATTPCVFCLAAADC